MIRRVLVRYAELAEATLAVDRLEAYGLLDGLFQQALLGFQRDPDGRHLAQLERQVSHLVPSLMTTAPQG